MSAVIELTTTAELDLDADVVWSLLADYSRDPDWRAGVESMTVEPSGPVRTGAVTAEVLRLAGRTSCIAGVVTSVGPGRTFTWRTTSGADADGRRRVEPLPGGRCRVVFDLRVRPHGAERLLLPVLRRVLPRQLRADLDRLRVVAAAVQRDAVG